MSVKCLRIFGAKKKAKSAGSVPKIQKSSGKDALANESYTVWFIPMDYLPEDCLSA
jgi:hypothetical protein